MVRRLLASVNLLYCFDTVGWVTGNVWPAKKLLQILPKVLLWGPGPAWSNSIREGQLNTNWVLLCPYHTVFLSKNTKWLCQIPLVVRAFGLLQEDVNQTSSKCDSRNSREQFFRHSYAGQAGCGLPSFDEFHGLCYLATKFVFLPRPPIWVCGMQPKLIPLKLLTVKLHRLNWHFLVMGLSEFKIEYWIEVTTDCAYLHSVISYVLQCMNLKWQALSWNCHSALPL